MSEQQDPPPLDDVDELDDYWTETTTISVNRYTKRRLDEHRDGRPWDVYLEQLRREHADPLTLSGVQQVADALVEELPITAGEERLAADITDALETIEERTGRIERMVDELGGHR